MTFLNSTTLIGTYTVQPDHVSETNAVTVSLVPPATLVDSAGDPVSLVLPLSNLAVNKNIVVNDPARL